MVKGVKKGPYTHTPTGRVFSDYNDYLVAKKAWDKRYGHLTISQYQSQKLREEKEANEKMRKEKREKLRKEIELVEKERDLWVKVREQKVRRDTTNLREQLSEHELLMEKHKLAASICRKALNNSERAIRKEWEKENPFPKEKELKRLRNKVYTI